MMGKHSKIQEKHSKVKEKKAKNARISKVFFLLLLFIILILAMVCMFQNQIRQLFFKDNNIFSKDEGITEQQKLVIKSTMDFNRVITFEFETNILKSINIYEQYEDKEKFLEDKKEIELMKDINIISIDEEELSIEIEKKDLGEDINKSYDEIYDKYLNELIGMYEIVS